MPDEVKKIKKHTLWFRAINRDTFLDIKSGKKTVETRAATKKYAGIKAGDVLVLVCGKEQFEKEVRAARIFRTIRALVKVYPIKSIMPKIRFEEELREAYYSYPDYKDKIKKFGLIALSL